DKTIETLKQIPNGGRSTTVNLNLVAGAATVVAGLLTSGVGAAAATVVAGTLTAATGVSSKKRPQGIGGTTVHLALEKMSEALGKEAEDLRDGENVVIKAINQVHHSVQQKSSRFYVRRPEILSTVKPGPGANSEYRL
ncbi:MAG: hypothetical protein ACRD0P_18825, partial [Stackebrandtia sp.]